MDNHSKEVRSYNMSQIRSTNTKIEEMLRKYLFSKGMRFKKNVKTMPGSPDIVFPKYKTVLFVNGCFWHMHMECSQFRWPKSNVDYWENKIKRNADRDKQNYADLINSGWKVIIIWECELKKKSAEKRLEQLYNEIICNL